MTVRADEGDASRIEQVLSGSGSVDIAARRASYQSNDWSHFDDTAAGYGTAEVTAERQRTRTL